MGDYQLTDSAAKKLLKIDTWRNMSKDKFIQFVSNLDRMDPEVAKKAIEQFPNFSRLVSDAVKDYKSSMETAIKENTALNNQLMSLYNHAIDAVKEIGSGADISWEQKKYCIDTVKELVQMASDATAKTQETNANHTNVFAFILVSLVSVALTLLGVNSKFHFSGKRV